jgi:redox-sensitive bicupin YhaK (pirin superfamily)
VSGIVPEGGPFELLLTAQPRDLGGFTVRRSLPWARRRSVGPFVFFDHIGPAEMSPGAGLDVRPHPHIGLATVTFLFEGSFDHRDSVGTFQTIHAGDVNWMIAGSGIVHSERSGPAARRDGGPIHGLQIWVALPREHEETAPRFEHHPANTLPRWRGEGASVDVVAGTAFGARSPVGVLSPTLYAHGRLDAGASLVVDQEHEERAIYVVEGEIVAGDVVVQPGTMAVLRPGADLEIRATAQSRVMLVGGAALDGERFMEWNFVSSSKERIERAKADWREGRFPKVPGDEAEFIPLP